MKTTQIEVPATIQDLVEWIDKSELSIGETKTELWIDEGSPTLEQRGDKLAVFGEAPQAYVMALGFFVLERLKEQEEAAASGAEPGKDKA